MVGTDEPSKATYRHRKDRCYMCPYLNVHRRSTSVHGSATGVHDLQRFVWCCSYTQALELLAHSRAADGGAGRHRLLANRSLAYGRAGRWSDALSDATAATEEAPKWDKGYWRKGAALAGLRRSLEAVAAYHRAWELSGGGCRLICRIACFLDCRRQISESLGNLVTVFDHAK